MEKDDNALNTSLNRGGEHLFSGLQPWGYSSVHHESPAIRWVMAVGVWREVGGGHSNADNLGSRGQSGKSAAPNMPVTLH